MRHSSTRITSLALTTLSIAVTLACIACDNDLRPVVVSVNGQAARDVLLVRDGERPWQQLTLTNGEATFTPEAASFGVAYACQQTLNGDTHTKSVVRWLTRDDAEGNNLRFGFCAASDDAPMSQLTVTGLANGQRLVVNGAAFTPALASQAVRVVTQDVLGVLWQLEPPLVLGFTRHAAPTPGTPLSIDAGSATAPDLLELPLAGIDGEVYAGVTALYNEADVYAFDTFGPSAGTIALPPAALRTPGDLLELDVTEFISPSQLRYVQRLTTTPAPFTPRLPQAWNAPAPQLVGGGLDATLTPRANWDGWYSYSLVSLTPTLWQQQVIATSAWVGASGQARLAVPDFAAFAAWYSLPAGSTQMEWWSDATSTTSPDLIEGRELSVARTSGTL